MIGTSKMHNPAPRHGDHPMLMRDSKKLVTRRWCGNSVDLGYSATLGYFGAVEVVVMQVELRRYLAVLITCQGCNLLKDGQTTFGSAAKVTQ
eukprot:6487985-Amphidinium_carterae.3